MLKEADLQDRNQHELIALIRNLQSKLQETNVVIESKEQKLKEHQSTIATLHEYIHLLKHGNYAASSERFVDDNPQGRLFDEAEEPAIKEVSEIEAIEATITVPEYQRRKQGRKGIDKALPREQVIYDLSELEKTCTCGCQMTHIGDDITEQLDIIPAQYKVLQHICKKYACKACEIIKSAKKPAQPIPKSIAAPGLLAHVLTAKFEYHLPLYRQEKMIKALGVDINRNTLSLWVVRCSKLLQSLVNLLQDEILKYDIAYADETTVQVLKEDGKTAQSKSYMWAFGGGPPERFSYIYQYHPGRNYSVATDFFREFSGYLHCDGYQSYDALANENKSVKQVGCWYHMRRKFSDAAKVSKKPGKAVWFLKEIGRLSKVEANIKNDQLNPDEAKACRLEKAMPIIEKIKLRLDELTSIVDPSNLLGKAIKYANNQ